MKRVIILIFAILVFPGFKVASQSLPVYLKGTWKSEQADLYEHWDQLNDKQMLGFSFSVKDGKMKVTEYLGIEIEENQLIYTATVIGQNNGEAVRFRFQSGEGKLTFANPGHDFPKIIQYQLLAPDTLKTLVGTNKKSFAAKFFRIY